MERPRWETGGNRGLSLIHLMIGSHALIDLEPDESAALLAQAFDLIVRPRVSTPPQKEVG